MDPVNYYLTTLTTAFKQLLPIIVFLVGGYFIFIKLPFLFLKKNMQKEKGKLLEEKKNHQSGYKIGTKQREKTSDNKNRPENQNKKKSDSGFKKDSDYKTQNKIKIQTPEEIFKFRPDELISQIELKKRYFELLKQNHPDRVASMGEDFKKLAEKNTKDINEAYEKLKGKAV